MGIALWVASGAIAFGIARIIPIGNRSRWRGELMAAVLTAVAFGLLATYLDFGGWNEADWRAGGFGLFGALAAIGVKAAALLPHSETSRGASQDRRRGRS